MGRRKNSDFKSMALRFMCVVCTSVLAAALRFVVGECTDNTTQ